MNAGLWWQNVPRPLKITFVFGAAPLITGVTIYLVWLLTRWNALMDAGLFTIVGGLASFLVGLVGIGVYLCQPKNSDPQTRRSGNRSAFLASLLLFSNFPAAWFCANSASDLHSRNTVVIINQGTSVVTGLTLTTIGGESKLVSPLSPGGKAQQQLRHFGDGQIGFTSTQPAITNGLIDSYSMGKGHYILIIKEDATYSVTRRNG